MNKKVISIVAIIAIVAILGVVLVACNASSYEKKLEKAGYDVKVFEGDDAKEESGDYEAKWAIVAKKDLTEYVTIICFKNTDDAKKAEEDAQKATFELLGVKTVCERKGKIVFFGTENAVKDAK